MIQHAVRGNNVELKVEMGREEWVTIGHGTTWTTKSTAESFANAYGGPRCGVNVADVEVPDDRRDGGFY